MCDPDPEFVVCYGYPENLPQEKIKVGGKILGRGEWLDGIRTRWGFKGKEGEEGEEGEEGNSADGGGPADVGEGDITGCRHMTGVLVNLVHLG